MTGENIILSWTPDIEQILENIRSNSVIMAESHKYRFLHLKGTLRYFRLPVIIIAGFNSVISVGFQPYIEQATISAITCLLSLTCGIIGSIELYLAIQSQMENELIVSKEYYLLSTSIFKMLTLSVMNRKLAGLDYLEECYNSYTELIDKSNVINKKIKDKLTPISMICDSSYIINESVNVSNNDNDNDNDNDNYYDNYITDEENILVCDEDDDKYLNTNLSELRKNKNGSMK